MNPVKGLIITAAIVAQVFLYYYITTDILHLPVFDFGRHEVVFVSEETNETIVKKVKSGDLVNEPNMERYGYSIEGWYTNTSFNSANNTRWTFNLYTVDNDVVLYAHWVEEEYTVKFFIDSNTLSKVETASFGTSIELPRPTREGYVFAGWYITQDYQYQVYVLEVQHDTNLYAKWEPIN